jgi:hypothetical protein
MQTGGNTLLVSFLWRRVIVAARGAVHALAMVSALLSTGALPAAFAGGSEIESLQHEGSAAQGADVQWTVRTRVRRPSPHLCDSFDDASLLPANAQLKAHDSTRILSGPRVSLGLMIPMRC